MNNLISGYLAREILKTSFATLLVLYIILVSNALGRVLADIADGEIPQQGLWPVMLSQSVSLLSLLLPIAVFLGIVFAFGRMYKDHEITVMNACGIGYLDFYKPVAMVVLPIFLLSVYLSLWLNAMADYRAQVLVDLGKKQHQFQQIKAGQFNQSEGGDHVFFMESISDDRLLLKDIIISQTSRDEMILETAASGRQKIDEVSGDLFLVVGPGQRYEGRAGANDHRLISFDQHGILIENSNDAASSRVHSRQLTPRQLRASPDFDHWVELHWRMAIPILLLVLAILAVPLAYIAPRQGRFGKVGYALLVYIVYINLLAVTRAQLEAGVFPASFGFWWVHVIFLLLAFILLWQRNRGVLSKPATT